MISEAKNLLQGIVHNAVPAATIVKSVSEESKAIMARQFPLVSLVTNPGQFDDSEARIVRYYAGEPKSYFERYVRGHRNVPILIRCWANGEEEADQMVSDIIPEIPSQWDYDDFTNHIKIGAEEYSDHTGNLGKPYVAVVEVIFTGTAARKPEQKPVFNEVENEGADIAQHE